MPVALRDCEVWKFRVLSRESLPALLQFELNKFLSVVVFCNKFMLTLHVDICTGKI